MDEKGQLHLGLSSGAAGDMLLAALAGVLQQLAGDHSSFDRFRQTIEQLLKLEADSSFRWQTVTRCGEEAFKIDFYVGEVHADHHGSHGAHHGSEHHHAPHTTLAEVLQLIDTAAGDGVITAGARRYARQIYTILAEAEAEAHLTTPEQVHFHEVGAFDSVMDILGFSVAFDLLAPRSVSASAVAVGSGTVNTAHGVLTVPTPAVGSLVRRFKIPVAETRLPGECLTPTGAAILAAIVQRWAFEPVFLNSTIEASGAGTRDFKEQPNVVRMSYGTVVPAS